MKFHFLFHLWRKKVLHWYYWDTIEESIDCTFISGTIWKTNNNNIQEEIDCTLFCSESMKDWQFCSILLEVYYQNEIPFPVSPLKEKSFPLILLGYNTFISGIIWKTNNNNIQEEIDCTLFCSESIWKTGNFAAFYWKCTTKMKFHFLFHLWRKKVFHWYYWDIIEESIDCTFISGTIWKTNNNNI